MKRFRLFPYSDETWYTHYRSSLPFVLDIGHGVYYVWTHNTGALQGTEMWS